MALNLGSEIHFFLNANDKNILSRIVFILSSFKCINYLIVFSVSKYSVFNEYLILYSFILIEIFDIIFFELISRTVW